MPAASSAGSRARVSRKGDFALSVITLSQASPGYSASGAPHVAPALLTRMSSRGESRDTSAASRSHSSSRDRSAGMLTHVPTLESSAATSSQTSAFRDEM